MGASVLSVPHTTVHPNEAIEVSYNLKGKDYEAGSCWIGLIPNLITSTDENVNDSHDVDYFHVYNDKGTGTLKTSKAGTYFIKCFATDNGGAHIATYTSTIYVSYIKIKDSGNYYDENDTINILYDFQAFNDEPEPIKFGNGWIGIIPSKIKHRDEYTNDKYDTNYCRMLKTKKGCISMAAVRGDPQNENEEAFELRVFPRDDGGQQIGVGIPIIIKKPSLIQEITKLHDAANKQIVECTKLHNQLNEIIYSVDTITHSIDIIERIGSDLKQIGNKINEIESKLNKKMNQMECKKNTEIVETTENKIMELSQKYSSIQSKFNQSQLKAIKAMKASMISI